MPDLRQFFDLASQKELVSGKTDLNGEPIFFASATKLGKVLSRDPGYLNRVINRLVYLGLLDKPQNAVIPKEVLRESWRYAQAAGHNLHISYFSIPLYGAKRLAEMRDRLARWKANHYSMRGFSREMILRMEGPDEANRVFPQLRNWKLSGQSVEMAGLFDKVVLELVRLNGYSTEEQVIGAVSLMSGKSPNRTKTYLKRMLGDILEKHGLTVIRATKELKARYGIGGRGYPNLILGGEGASNGKAPAA